MPNFPGEKSSTNIFYKDFLIGKDYATNKIWIRFPGNGLKTYPPGLKEMEEAKRIIDYLCKDSAA